MTDSYSTFVDSGIGAKLAGALGLPRPRCSGGTGPVPC